VLANLTILINANWIFVYSKIIPDPEKAILYVYMLPQDVGRTRVERSTKMRQNQVALEQLLVHIDVSPEAWNGSYEKSKQQVFDTNATPEEASLFYIYNTLPSPSPSPSKVADRYTRAAIQGLLENNEVFKGLKTMLYPYQGRSAALMLQRETAPELTLDPRLELRESPTGQMFYYGPRHATFLKHPRMYDSVRGGILSETMGLGKTIICLAVIVATKGHLPKTPPQYLDRTKERPRVGSLMQMAIATANRHSLPARTYFERVRDETGEDYATCIDAISATPQQYSIRVVPARWNRKTSMPEPKIVTLCSGTIVVVPRNLVHQWELEIRKHVVGGPSGLHVLVMNDPAQRLPAASELLKYDVVLFSKQCFEKEIHDGTDKLGRRTASGAALTCRCPYIGASRIRDCTCLREDNIYSSPLKELHWLRIIIDEGHTFSSRTSNAVRVANQLVRAERRWIVSGTPARNRLFGVEVDVDDSRLVREIALHKRKRYNKEEEMKGPAESIGQLASGFLKVRPWAASEFDSEKADWDEHVFRHDRFHAKTYSAFSTSLRRTLESLVVKTRPEDVERDIVLPPLHHRVVYLEPSFYDKLTVNLFHLFFTSNAILCERTDEDYLFHQKNRKHRNTLIANLRHSNFFWTGFEEDHVKGAIKAGEEYLKKENTNCSLEDRQLLQRCLDFAQFVDKCNGWKALSKSHELGLFVDDWPDKSSQAWSLPGSDYPAMIGVTQLLRAQSRVNSQVLEEDPFEGLEALGVAATMQALVTEDEAVKGKKKQQTDEPTLKKGIPTSSLLFETSSAKRHHQGSPTKANPNKRKRSSETSENTQANQTPVIATPKPQRKRKLSGADRLSIPVDSPIRKASLIGTTSSKLSYLLEQILKYHHNEKILIFYDWDNTAYYVAQCLELLHITHLIYAKSLPSERRSRYIVAFDENPRIRVLLMDVRCGAEGLNVNKASRVFFINPCCRPNIEAQAIKRSHRIGQTKPVHVETLILKGTVEEAMFKRAKAMTETEHRNATELQDDTKIASILQNSQSLPVGVEDLHRERKMAALGLPQQIFGREG
ncbi:hypothetical protein NA57DRAFT_19969, partial [Rhizodiscina lignyota]